MARQSPNKGGELRLPFFVFAYQQSNGGCGCIDSGINIMGKRQRRLARQHWSAMTVAQPQPELVTFEVGDKVRIRGWHKVLPGKHATIKSSPINMGSSGRSYWVSIWRDYDEPLRLRVEHSDLELLSLAGTCTPLLSTLCGYDAAVLSDDGRGVMI